MLLKFCPIILTTVSFVPEPGLKEVIIGAALVGATTWANEFGMLQGGSP
jgi:hypothetical protein